MTMMRDMAVFFDGNGLVCPDSELGSPYKRGSDNGVLHTSRYLIVQKYLGEPLDEHALTDLLKCRDNQGYLHRDPDDTSEDTPDDYYGLISCFSVLNITTKIALPWKCFHPALLYMSALQRNALGALIARVFSPLIALIIALSNLSSSSEISDKMLTWNVIQGTRKSLFCRLGAKLWYMRHDIQTIAQGYYPNNPLGKAIK